MKLSLSKDTVANTGRGRIEEAWQALARFGVEADTAAPKAPRGSYAELFRRPWRTRALAVVSVFFLVCISSLLGTIALSYVLRTVGALSMQASLAFSAIICCTSMVGVPIEMLLIDRIGRRRLFCRGAIPEGLAAVSTIVTGPHNPTFLIVGFIVFSFCNWFCIAGNV